MLVCAEAANLSVAWCEAVRVLKSVVLPDFGSPRMPSCTGMSSGSGRPAERDGRLPQALHAGPAPHQAAAVRARISVSWTTEPRSTHSSSAWAPVPCAPITTVSTPASARSEASIQNVWPTVAGQTFWMDASLLAEAGVETVVIGAHGTGAHADEEWVDLGSVVQLTEILARTAAAWCGAGPA